MAVKFSEERFLLRWVSNLDFEILVVNSSSRPEEYIILQIKGASLLSDQTDLVVNRGI